MTCTRSSRTELALLLTRIGVGTIFVAHAFMQLQVGVGSLATLLGSSLGFPLPNLFAWLTVFIELFGGLALIVGVATPIAATLLSIITIASLIMIKAKLGLIARTGVGAELEIALLVGTVSVGLEGAGWYAVDRRLKWFQYECPCQQHSDKA